MDFMLGYHGYTWLSCAGARLMKGLVSLPAQTVCLQTVYIYGDQRNGAHSIQPY